MIVTYQKFLTGTALFMCVHAYAMNLSEVEMDGRDVEAGLHEEISGAELGQRADAVIVPAQFADDLIVLAGDLRLQSRDDLISWMERLSPEELRELSDFVKNQDNPEYRSQTVILTALDTLLRDQKGELRIAKMQCDMMQKEYKWLQVRFLSAICLTIGLIVVDVVRYYVIKFS